MIYGVIFDSNTGQILRCVSTTPENLMKQVNLNEDAIEADMNVRDDIYYVKERDCILRPVQTTTVNKVSLLADGVDFIEFSNVPSGTFSARKLYNQTEIFTEQPPEVAISGDIVDSDTFSTIVSGSYKIKIESFPYLDFEIIVEAI
jgi:hypothetical protein